MSRRRGAGRAVSDGFPRVSGDEPETNVKAYYDYPFSPRERG